MILITSGKIVSVDHSGYIQSFDAIADRENAEEFTRSLKKILDREKENDKTLKFCDDGKSYDDFLAGGSEMHCETEFDEWNTFDIAPYKDVYRVKAQYDGAEIHEVSSDKYPDVPEPIIELYYEKDGRELYVRTKDKKMKVFDLYDASL